MTASPLPTVLVVPAPDLGLDRLAHRGHVLEVVVVLGRLVRADLAQHPDGGGRGVEDVHAEPLGDPPRPPGVGVVGRAFVDHAGGAERQRPVDDVGMAGDPPDVGHAPVGVVGVDVLVVLGRPRHVGEIAADAVLCTLGPARGAGGVHQEQRRIGGQRDRLHQLAVIGAEHLVHEEVPALGHGGLRAVLAGVAPPHQHLVDPLALLPRLGHGLVGLHLVVDEIAAAVVAVHRDQHPAARVGDPGAAGIAAEAAEDLRVDDAKPGAGEHRHRQLGDHRHVQRHPVTRLEPAEVPQQRRELVHPVVEVAVGDGDVVRRLRLRNPDQGRLVAIGGDVPVHAVVGGIQPAAGKPLPVRRIAGVQDRVPFLVPAQQVRVFGEAVRETVFRKPVEDGRIGRVGLGDERLRGIDVLLLAPVHRNLSLGDLTFCHLLLLLLEDD